MALQSSGQITLAQIASEFGGSAPHSLSEYYGKRSGIPASGQIQLGADFYGTGVLGGTYLGNYLQSSGSTNFSTTVNNGSGTANDLIVICFGHETTGNYSTYDEVFTVNGTTCTKAIFENTGVPSGSVGTRSRVGIWYISPNSNGTIAGDTTLTVAKTTTQSPFGFRCAISVYRVNNGVNGTVSAGGSQAVSNTNVITATNSSTTNKLIMVASHMPEGGNHSLSATNGSLTQNDLINTGANNGDGQSGYITGCTGSNSVSLTRVTGSSTGGHDGIVTAVIF